MKPPISNRKRAANQQNARKSRGPRTAEGKARASQNAVKHGLSATNVLILVGDGKEDQQAYNDLQDRLWAECQPVGVREELTVKQLGDEFFKQHFRVDRAEQGAIRRRVDALQASEAARRQQDFEDAKALDLPDLGRTSLGLSYLLEELALLIEKIEPLDPAAPVHLVGDDMPAALRRELVPVVHRVQALAAEACKAAGLRALHGLHAQWTRDKTEAEARERREVDAKLARWMLPAAGELDRILRYKTAGERTIHRLLVRLQMLQATRRKEAREG